MLNLRVGERNCFRRLFSNLPTAVQPASTVCMYVGFLFSHPSLLAKPKVAFQSSRNIVSNTSTGNILLAKILQAGMIHYVLVSGDGLCAIQCVKNGNNV